MSNTKRRTRANLCDSESRIGLDKVKTGEMSSDVEKAIVLASEFYAKGDYTQAVEA